MVFQEVRVLLCVRMSVSPSGIVEEYQSGAVSECKP